MSEEVEDVGMDSHHHSPPKAYAMEAQGPNNNKNGVKGNTTQAGFLPKVDWAKLTGHHLHRMQAVCAYLFIMFARSHTWDELQSCADAYMSYGNPDSFYYTGWLVGRLCLKVACNGLLNSITPT